jgi:hypothetical protein
MKPVQNRANGEHENQSGDENEKDNNEDDIPPCHQRRDGGPESVLLVVG